ncbi:alpha-N-acetylgalactosaminide alpha-2,6-sialyltransferase 3-like [Lytechinus variegatus]|uniref:alpha-N-acetylgalactosaminide alpha-2,6-sialyltransferase 3-like n=1 Tax=Lytechinus variegatus TaxID=7654 RepID=UPI001BB11DF7|nr:alpha-N-acetylgalactosaminide alpha-2,6-sialyltransferase 3-like [Lytechinus variegatus]
MTGPSWTTIRLYYSLGIDSFDMNKIALLNSLLLLASALMLLILVIFTGSVEHRLILEYVPILPEASKTDSLNRREFQDDLNDSKNDSRTPNTTLKVGIILRNSDGQIKNLSSPSINTVGSSSSRKHEYLLLDSRKELDLHCKQCALVFSSGHLLGSNMGKEIDNTECVIRQNMAPVLKHVKDVGMRTTVRVVGHSNIKRGLLTPQTVSREILSNPRTRPSIIYVPWLYNETIDRTTNKVFQHVRSLNKLYPKVQYYFQSDDMIGEMDEMFMDETGLNRTEIESWFSTGYMSVLFVLDICDSVVCYGVSDADYCKREPESPVSYHYFDTSKNPLRECSYYNEREYLVKGGHKFLTEKKLYAKWAQHRNLTFRAPTWPKSAFNWSSEFESPYLNVYRKAKEDGSFANYVNKPVIDNNPKPLSNNKVKRPLLRRFKTKRRQVPIRLPNLKLPRSLKKS